MEKPLQWKAKHSAEQKAKRATNFEDQMESRDRNSYKQNKQKPHTQTSKKKRNPKKWRDPNSRKFCFYIDSESFRFPWKLATTNLISLHKRKALHYPWKRHKPWELFSPSKYFTKDLTLLSSCLGSITATQSPKDTRTVCAARISIELYCTPPRQGRWKKQSKYNPPQRPQNIEVFTPLLMEIRLSIPPKFRKLAEMVKIGNQTLHSGFPPLSLIVSHQHSSSGLNAVTSLISNLPYKSRGS